MKIIIVGLGKIGYKLAELLSSEEHEITAVDSSPDKIRYIVNEHNIMGVVGSGTDANVLKEAGVNDADLLIAVTGSDETNLLSCLIAKKTGNLETIARIRKIEYTKSLHIFKDDLGLTLSMNTQMAAARGIARILRFPSAIQIDTFSKGRVEILKFRIQETRQ